MGHTGWRWRWFGNSYKNVITPRFYRIFVESTPKECKTTSLNITLHRQSHCDELLSKILSSYSDLVHSERGWLRWTQQSDVCACANIVKARWLSESFEILRGKLARGWQRIDLLVHAERFNAMLDNTVTRKQAVRLYLCWEIDGVRCNLFYFHSRKSTLHRDICVVHGTAGRDTIDYIDHCLLDMNLWLGLKEIKNYMTKKRKNPRDTGY